MFSPSCPVCGSSSKKLANPEGRDLHEFDCKRCGRFSITGSAEAVLENKKPTDRQKMNLSSWLRQNSGSSINTTNLDSLLSLAAPTFAERADLLLGRIAREAAHAGASVSIEAPGWGSNGEMWCSISWSLHWEELVYLLTAYLSQLI